MEDVGSWWQLRPGFETRARDMRRELIMLVVASAYLYGCASASCGDGLTELFGSCVDTTRCEVECGANEVCDFDVDPIGCKCASGFSGSPCAWSGVVTDPGFADPAAWSDAGRAISAGAEVLRNGGDLDPGEAKMRQAVACNGGGLRQVLDMPPLDVAGPLVVHVVYQALEVDLGIGFDSAWVALPQTTNSWADARFCLGEAAYGGEKTLELGAAEPTAACSASTDVEIRIDRISVEPDESGACPAPGTALNGDAEGVGGWEFEPALSGDLEGEGVNSSAAARIVRPEGSAGQVSMHTPVSVPIPSDTAAPALSYFWRGTIGARYRVDLGTFDVDAEARTRRPIDRLIGDNAESTATYCLPPWTYGTVVDLVFATTSDGVTADNTLRVDDVAVSLREECLQSNVILDPGFETGEFFDWAGLRIAGGAAQAIALQWNDAPPPRNGSGSLEFRYSGSDLDMRIENFVLVPEFVEDEAPWSLIFYARAAEPPEARVTWSLGAPPSFRNSLEPSNEWTCTEVPLPTGWDDRWYRFSVEVRELLDGSSATGARSLQLDDFALTQEGCP